MILRLANMADLPALTEMVALASAELEEKHGTPRMDGGIIACLRIGIESRQAVVVAEQEGELVGWCARVMLPGLAPGHAEGVGTWTSPEHRKQGVAHDMRKFADEYAKSIGVRFITGIAAKDNVDGMMSARADGYEVIGYQVRKEL